MLTLDTKNVDTYKSKSTWRSNTRSVIHDANTQSIHRNAGHNVISVEDIKKKRKKKKSTVLSDKLSVSQLLRTHCF
jgi:hypothetical protein